VLQWGRGVFAADNGPLRYLARDLDVLVVSGGQPLYHFADLGEHHGGDDDPLTPHVFFLCVQQLLGGRPYSVEQGQEAIALVVGKVLDRLGEF
jgi:hypothetical protein